MTIKRNRLAIAAIALLGLMIILAGVFVPQTASNAVNNNNNQSCVPKDAWTETIEHPEVFHYETVVVTPAAAAVPGQHYSLKGNSGIGRDEVPDTPAVNPDIWQANTAQEPHDNGAGDPVTWLTTPGSGLHYASHGSSGLRDWFFYRAAVDAQDAVTKQVKVIDKAAWTEVIKHPEVVCDKPTDNPSNPIETPTTVLPSETPNVSAETPAVTDDENTPIGTPEQPELPEPYCLGNALVTETEGGKSYENGHPACAPDKTGAIRQSNGQLVVVKEEGL